MPYESAPEHVPTILIIELHEINQTLEVLDVATCFFGPPFSVYPDLTAEFATSTVSVAVVRFMI